jgi:hypothetical protein
MKRLAECLVAGGLMAGALAAAPPSAPIEDFFIVSSVDTARSTMVLKRPTEVTLTMRFTEKTRCRTEQGKPIRPTELRAGDTVFIASVPDPSGLLVATAIRRGAMTLPELRQRYLRPGA